MLPPRESSYHGLLRCFAHGRLLRPRDPTRETTTTWQTHEDLYRIGFEQPSQRTGHKGNTNGPGKGNKRAQYQFSILVRFGHHLVWSNPFWVALFSSEGTRRPSFESGCSSFLWVDGNQFNNIALNGSIRLPSISNKQNWKKNNNRQTPEPTNP